MTSFLNRFCLIAVLALPMPAAAADQLVAECADPDTQVGYRVFQTSDEPTFRAESLNGRVKFPEIDLLIANEGMLAWIAPAGEVRQFMLIVNRTDVTGEDFGGELTTDGFRGRVRCKLP